MSINIKSTNSNTSRRGLARASLQGQTTLNKRIAKLMFGFSMTFSQNVGPIGLLTEIALDLKNMATSLSHGILA